MLQLELFFPTKRHFKINNGCKKLNKWRNLLDWALQVTRGMVPIQLDQIFLISFWFPKSCCYFQLHRWFFYRLPTAIPSILKMISWSVTSHVSVTFVWASCGRQNWCSNIDNIIMDISRGVFLILNQKADVKYHHFCLGSIYFQILWQRW
jgi:hypothetical protein